MMKWGTCFILLLLAIAGCSESIHTEPGAVESAEPAIRTTPVRDLCKDVKCPDNRICKNGNCVCPQGKECEGECIPTNACCTDADCNQAKCVDHKCVKDECSYGEAFKDGKCECKSEFKYCEEQGKCIPKDSCCTFLGCRSFEECVRTSITTSVCFEKDNKMKCKLISDLGRAEYFKVDDKDYKAEPLLFKEENLKIKINNETLTMQPNIKIDIDGIEVWIEDFKVMGGFCREEND